MKNHALKSYLSKILEQRDELTITKGGLSGASIDVHYKKTDVEFGRYLYYDREKQRYSDYQQLETKS